MALSDVDWRELGTRAADVAFVALVAGALVLGALKLTDRLDPPSARLQGAQVVVFDVVKYTNAQRAVASKLLGSKTVESLDSGALIMSVSHRVKDVITKIAGPGTVVLVRQAVIHGDAPDITDAVLLELGLPVNVPTAAPVDVLGDGASTLLSLSRRPPPQRSVPASRPSAGAAPADSSLLP